MKHFITVLIWSTSMIWVGLQTSSAQYVRQAFKKQFAMPNACGIVVNAGPDITICSNQGKRLNANVTGSTQYLWEPSDGLSDPTSLTPVATPSSTTTYTLTAKAVSGNLITNGGFENGNIAPSTSQYTPYTNVNNLITSTGGYMVMSVPQIAIAFGCTPNIGAFTMVITPTGSSSNIWCQTISVNANTEYKIDYKVFGIPYIFGAPPTIGLKINGTLIGTVDAISGLCLEATGSFTWNSGSNTSATICFANYGGTGPASMCAIDDIVVRECCEEKDEVTVTVYDLEAVVNPPDEINCLNRPITIDASGSTQGPGITYMWSTRNGKIKSGDKTLTPVVDSPGVYTLKIMGQFGCEAEVMVEVKGSVTPPDITAKKTDLDCLNSSAKIEASTKAAGPNFEWTGPNGYYSTKAVNFNIREPGEYIVKVTDTYGCESTAKVEVMDLRTMLEAEIIGDSLSCSKDSIVLQANSIATKPDYDWKGPNGYFKDSIQKITVRDTGWYYLTTRDSAGCIELDSFFVKSNAGNISIQLKSDTITCLKTQIQLFLQTDSLAQIEWTGPNQFQSNLKNPSVTEQGWYFAKVTTPDGCVGKDSVWIAKSSDVPDISVSANDTVNCIKTQVTLTGVSNSPGAQIVWISPSGNTNSQASIQTNIGGTYSFRVTGTNGCSIEKNVEITVDTSKPFVRLKADTLTCKKDSVILTNLTSSSEEHLWSGPQGFFSQLTNPKIGAGGLYFLTLIGMNGCSTTDSISIQEDKAVPSLSISGDTLTCSKTMVSPIVSSDPNTQSYQWTGPNAFASMQKLVSLDKPGLYTLLITGSNGCTNIRSVFIPADTIKPFAKLFADTITCKGNASLHANNWSGAITDFSWSGPQGFQSSDSTPTVQFGGIYKLSIRGTNGCLFEDSVEVIQKDKLPNLTVQNDTLTCIKTRLNLRIQTTSTGVRFEWVGPNGFQSNLPNPEVQDSGWYTIRLIDSSGCEISKQLYIAAFQQIPQVRWSSKGDTLTCLDSVLQVHLTGIQPSETIAWSGPSGFTSNRDSIEARIPGRYIIMVTNAYGCRWTDSLLIFENRKIPDVQLKADTLNCIKSRISLELISQDNDLVFDWNGPGGFRSILRNPIITAGGRYQLNVKNTAGCETIQWVDIAVDTLKPNLFLSADTLNCVRANVPVKASSSLQGFIMQWSGPNGFTYSFPQFNTNNPGLYTCTIINPRTGCRTKDSVWVLQDTSRIRGAQVLSIDANCANPSGMLDVVQINGGKAPYTYSLDNGLNFYSSLQNVPLNPGTYQILIRDANGCSYLVQSEIRRTDSVNIELPPLIELKENQTFTLPLKILSDPSRIASIRWSPADQLSCDQCINPILTAKKEAIIRVTVIDSNGCSAEAAIQLVIRKESKIYFPNVFSPNGDNINDYFYPIDFGQSSEVEFLRIFDRWGNLLFERTQFPTNQAEKGWNGQNAQGDKVMPGAYLFIVSILTGNTSQIFYGDITVIE